MCSCHHPHPPFVPHDSPVVAGLFGTSNLEGMEALYRLKRVSHLIGLLIATQHREDALSHARMRLLTHLVMGKLQGNDSGLLPSELSRFLGISRNTVSTLLNGLEAQGLIERHLHPDDRRQWLVRVTPEGEALIRARAGVGRLHRQLVRRADRRGAAYPDGAAGQALRGAGAAGRGTGLPQNGVLC